MIQLCGKFISLPFQSGISISISERCGSPSLAEHGNPVGCRHLLLFFFLPLIVLCSYSSYCETRHYQEHHGLAWGMKTDMVSGLLHWTSTGSIFDLTLLLLGLLSLRKHEDQNQTSKLHPAVVSDHVHFICILQSRLFSELCISDVSHRWMETHLSWCPCRSFLASYHPFVATARFYEPTVFHINLLMLWLTVIISMMCPETSHGITVSHHDDNVCGQELQCSTTAQNLKTAVFL